MTANMTPVKLEVLLHYYYCCEPYHRNYEAQKSVVCWAQKKGLLTIPTDPDVVLEMTQKGQVYVKAILKAASEVPLPTKIWACGGTEL